MQDGTHHTCVLRLEDKNIPASTHSWWDFRASSNSQSLKFVNKQIGLPEKNVLTLTENSNVIVDGKLGIGTDTPLEKLHIKGTDNWFAGARFENEGGYLKIGFNGAHGVIDSEHDIHINWYTGKNVIVGGGGSSNNLPATGSFISRYDTYLATSSGNVGIGTNCPDEKLCVAGSVKVSGSIRVNTEITVEDINGWCDYVFDENYKLLSIKEVAKFINKNNHLPGIPPAYEMEKQGFKVLETSKMMMEKIEELTLYIIQLENRLSELENNK